MDAFRIASKPPITKDAMLASARARGRVGGRRPILTQAQVAVAKQMLASPAHHIDDVAINFKVSRSTLYRAIR